MEKIGKLGEQGEMGGSGYFDRHGPRGLVGDIWGKTQKGTKEQTVTVLSVANVLRQSSQTDLRNAKNVVRSQLVTEVQSKECWRGGSVRTELAWQAGGPELYPQTHMRKPGRMVYAHAIPASTGEVEMGISLGLAVRPASLPHLLGEL